MFDGANGLPVRKLVGHSPAIRQLHEKLQMLGRRCCTVLIRGETGSGKELAARLIHAASPRHNGPFVPVDCTTLRDTLFESQLFGHVRGAFTGADRSTLGFFRAADGGTLFLDEIGELQPHVQAKLLRCIQDGAVVPLGSTRPIAVDVRIIAATHRDLPALVASGQFRQDLYYRINVACLHIPPLRQRKCDIPELVQHALEDLAAVYKEPVKTMAPEAMQILLDYGWPGNVRELINAIEHAFVFSTTERIQPEDLPESVRQAATPSNCDDEFPTLAVAEKNLIAAALRRCNGNQSLAARSLGIERHRLRRKILRYELGDLVKNSVR